MNDLYSIAGISKQGFHQWLDRAMERKEEQMQLLWIVQQIREDHPRMSCRKIYYLLMPSTMGRSRFERFCHEHGYKVNIYRSSYRTTDSFGVMRFPNVFHSLDEVTGVNQVWVSDITYFSIGSEVYYLSFIMDLYSRYIIGYSASKSLRTQDTTLPALKMAIHKRCLKKDCGLTLHSDGGGQYYADVFLDLTKYYGIKNSMGKTAYENPHAERVNGIIKNEYLYPYRPKNFDQLSVLLEKAVTLYNQNRPHLSLDKLCPQTFELLIESRLLTKKWLINKKTKATKKEKINISMISYE